MSFQNFTSFQAILLKAQTIDLIAVLQEMSGESSPSLWGHEWQTIQDQSDGPTAIPRAANMAKKVQALITVWVEERLESVVRNQKVDKTFSLGLAIMELQCTGKKKDETRL